MIVVNIEVRVNLKSGRLPVAEVVSWERNDPFPICHRKEVTQSGIIQAERNAEKVKVKGRCDKPLGFWNQH